MTRADLGLMLVGAALVFAAMWGHNVLPSHFKSTNPLDAVLRITGL